MSRRDELKQHLEKLSVLKTNLEKAHQEFEAYGAAFNSWLHQEIGLPADRTKDILMPEILLKWDENSDHASTLSS